MLHINAVAGNIIFENPVYYGLTAPADDGSLLEGYQLLDVIPGVSVGRVLYKSLR